MKNKKEHTTALLVWAIILFIVAGMFILTVVTLATSGAEFNLAGLSIVIVISLICIIIGIVLLLKRSQRMKNGGKKPGVVVIVIMLVVLIAGIPVAMNTMKIFGSSTKLTSELKKYVKDSYSSTDAELPDKPRFVFYNDGRFSEPSSNYIYGTGNPDEVNVVVEYSSKISRNGEWVNKGTGDKISDALTQTVDVHVIRLEDWALINETSFTYQLRQDESEMNVTGMNEFESYLKEVFGH